MRLLNGDVAAARTSEPRHALLVRAGVHLKKLRDSCNSRGTADRAFPRLDFTSYRLFREGPASRTTARAAIRQRQHLFHLFDSRIFPDVQLLVCDGEYIGKQHAQAAHQGRRNQKLRKHCPDLRSVR